MIFIGVTSKSDSDVISSVRELKRTSKRKRNMPLRYLYNKRKARRKSMKRNLLLFSRCTLLLFPLLSKRFLRFLNDETHFAKQIDGEKALSLFCGFKGNETN